MNESTAPSLSLFHNYLHGNIERQQVVKPSNSGLFYFAHHDTVLRPISCILPRTAILQDVDLRSLVEIYLNQNDFEVNQTDLLTYDAGYAEFDLTEKIYCRVIPNILASEQRILVIISLVKNDICVIAPDDYWLQWSKVFDRYIAQWNNVCCWVITTLIYRSPTLFSAIEEFDGQTINELELYLSESRSVNRDQFKLAMQDAYGFERFTTNLSDVSLAETVISAKFLSNCLAITVNYRKKLILLTAKPENKEPLIHIISVLGLTVDDIKLISPKEYYEHISITSLIDVSSALNSTTNNTVISANENLTIGSDIDQKAPIIVSLVDKILYQATERNASDIHISPITELTSQIRLRIDGKCITILSIDIDNHQALIARLKVMAELDIAERRMPQDGKFKKRVHDLQVIFRVVTVPCIYGETCVIRIHKDNQLKKLCNLAMPKNIKEKLFILLEQLHGMIIVTGPTGSGKTTTLHAMLNQIDIHKKTVWTAEDPVEIVQPGINQISIKENISFGFPEAIRTFLRADPDVILVGEMRDTVTAVTATQAAMTGHLVLSTLHTNSAVDSITRLQNLGVEHYNITDTLLAIVAQRLVRKLCSICKQPRELSNQDTELVNQFIDTMSIELVNSSENTITLYNAGKCDSCNYTGYSGRQALFELMEMTNSIRRAIYKNQKRFVLERLACENGMVTIETQAIQLFISGATSLEEITPLLHKQKRPPK